MTVCASVQVFVSALAARRKRVQLVHGSVAAGSVQRLHGLVGGRTCGRVSSHPSDIIMDVFLSMWTVCLPAHSLEELMT